MANAQLRSTRDSQTREAEMRDDLNWEESGLLQMPPAPPGFTYRWIRVMEGNEDAKANISRRLNEGWVFVKPDELPTGFEHLPVRDSGRYSGHVGVGDVALAKIPTAKVQARANFYQQKAQNMQMAVDQNMSKLSDNRLGKTFNNSELKVSRGGRPVSIDP